jgi:ribosome-associated protein
VGFCAAGGERRNDGLVAAPAPQVEIPEAELRWRFSRSSGPGGQHVNTTDSRVSLSWDLEASGVLDDTQRARARRRLAGDLVDGVLTVHASEHRSQARNRDVARDRLVAIVRAAVAPPPPRRRATRPTKASQARRVETKKRRAETKRLRQRPEH